jgi:hypothetical protein
VVDNHVVTSDCNLADEVNYLEQCTPKLSSVSVQFIPQSLFLIVAEEDV